MSLGRNITCLQVSGHDSDRKCHFLYNLPSFIFSNTFLSANPLSHFHQHTHKHSHEQIPLTYLLRHKPTYTLSPSRIHSFQYPHKHTLSLILLAHTLLALATACMSAPLTTPTIKPFCHTPPCTLTPCLHLSQPVVLVCTVPSCLFGSLPVRGCS